LDCKIFEATNWTVDGQNVTDLMVVKK